MMRKELQLFLKILVCYFFSMQLFAEEYLPKGCKAFVIKNIAVELKANKDHLIFFHNISGKQIWLANRDISKWTIELKPGLWNVFYLPKEHSTWRCIQSELGHEQQVSCQDAIALCQWPVSPPDTSSKKQGAWLIDNQSIVVAKAYLQRMGWLFDQVSSKLVKETS